MVITHEEEAVLAHISLVVSFACEMALHDALGIGYGINDTKSLKSVDANIVRRMADARKTIELGLRKMQAVVKDANEENVNGWVEVANQNPLVATEIYRTMDSTRADANALIRHMLDKANYMHGKPDGAEKFDRMLYDMSAQRKDKIVGDQLRNKYKIDRR